MTQSLLGDLASQMFLLKELSTDVQAIKTQQSMLSSQVRSPLTRSLNRTLLADSKRCLGQLHASTGCLQSSTFSQVCKQPRKWSSRLQATRQTLHLC